MCLVELCVGGVPYSASCLFLVWPIRPQSEDPVTKTDCTPGPRTWMCSEIFTKGERNVTFLSLLHSYSYQWLSLFQFSKVISFFLCDIFSLFLTKWQVGKHIASFQRVSQEASPTLASQQAARVEPLSEYGILPSARMELVIYSKGYCGNLSCSCVPNREDLFPCLCYTAEPLLFGVVLIVKTGF